ncbi:MAG: hypothetical protein F4Z33_03995 [Gemmatimonadales bacterium]|nr:hypothetical protein [Gemmatimonadales bacterium]
MVEGSDLERLPRPKEPHEEGAGPEGRGLVDPNRLEVRVEDLKRDLPPRAVREQLLAEALHVAPATHLYVYAGCFVRDPARGPQRAAP